MKKVAVYIISDGIGGAEQVVWNTIRELRNLPGIYLIVNNEISHYYSSLLDDDRLLNIGNVYLHQNRKFRRIRYLLNNRFYSLKPLIVRCKTRIVSRFLAYKGISTIHAHMEFALYSALKIKKRNKEFKILYTVHSAFRFLGDKKLKPQYRIADNEFASVDIVIFVSRYNLNLFLTNNIPVNRYHVIYNSINLKLLPVENKDIPNDGKFHILYVGGAKHVKGYDILVWSVKILISEFNITNLKITILGIVPRDSEFIKLINYNGLSSYFDFSGFIEPPGHYKHFQQADLLFMPSRSEAMPMAAVEALFFNIPIVASNVGGLPELISNGENGYLCSPEPAEFAKAIACSVTNYDQLHRSTANFNQNIRKAFDSEVVMKQICELYFE